MSQVYKLLETANTSLFDPHEMLLMCIKLAFTCVVVFTAKQYSAYHERNITANMYDSILFSPQRRLIGHTV